MSFVNSINVDNYVEGPGRPTEIKIEGSFVDLLVKTKAVKVLQGNGIV